MKHKNLNEAIQAIGLLPEDCEWAKYPYMALIYADVGLSLCVGLCKEDWEDVLGEVRRKFRNEFKDGQHVLKSGGNSWNGNKIRGGCGKVFCYDKPSFEWIKCSLKEYKTARGTMITVWGWNEVDQWILVFFIRKILETVGKGCHGYACGGEWVKGKLWPAIGNRTLFEVRAGGKFLQGRVQ